MIAPATRRLSVGIVDDDTDIRALVRHLLGRTDLARLVAEADGSPASVAALCRQTPQAVLLDQGLDGWDGTELIGTILRRCPLTMIAMFSGLPREHLEPEAARRGAFAWYEKTPAVLESLPARLVEDYALFERALTGEEVVAPACVN